MRVAYLVNQYPKVSHSFIRREISGIEKTDIQVFRYSIRPIGDELVDAADKAEFSKTRIVLDVGIVGLLKYLIMMLLRKPINWLRCFALMLSLSWVSDRSLFHHLAYMAEACVLFRWFSDAKIDHVHAHFGTNSATVAMLCQTLGGPEYSFTVHGPEEFDKPVALSLQEKIKRAAFVIAVSSFGQSQLYRWCLHDQWSKIHVVHCGVDSEYLSSGMLAPLPKEAVLVCVGRLSEQKGHFLLLEAAKMLVESGHHFKLLFVGDGPLRPQIETLIVRWKLQDVVEITGWASGPEVRDRIIKARTLVLPSFAEGLPVVIMEALALGRPVISTYIAGIPELLESKVCGWLIPSGSVEALTASMAEAIQLPLKTLETMGQAGALRISQRHDSALESKKLAALFLAQSDFSPEPNLRRQELNKYEEMAYRS